MIIPPVSQKVVRRPRLIERMNSGFRGDDDNFACKLTLVSAPAGYGKTTLVAGWLAELAADDSAHNLTWLSLGATDNDFARFFSYLIVALQQIDTAIGAEIQPILESDTDHPVEPLITALVNDIAAWGGTRRPGQRCVLVLDDYYLITEFSIHTALDFLIDHLPPCMQMVIMTRVDPPIPLGRLRVQQALLEIREVDLKFTVDEATAFLNRLMELDLSAEDIKTLEARTEGWIAGLQLAALTLHDQGDKHDLIAAFSGSHRHLIDYLAHEVMSRQTEEVQSFLLRTSILERFSASLCAAVTSGGTIPVREAVSPGHPASTSPMLQSREILDQLEVANMFLIALDDNRQWYRYHHLFADFLEQRLRETQPEIIPDLFIRASQWYEAQGLVDEAIEYAFKSGFVPRAAKLLDACVEALVFNAELDKVLRWAKRLPEDVRARFPRLCIYHAWALQFEYQLDLVEPTLALAEAHLADSALLSEPFSASQIAGHANAIRVFTAMKMGELDRAVELSLAALRVLPKENTEEVLVMRGAITLGLGMGYLELGQVEPAYQTFQEALHLNQMTGNRYAALSSVYMLINLEKVRGALNQALANSEKGLIWIDEWSRTRDRGGRLARNLAYFRLALGLVQYEQNELDQAVANMKKARDYFEIARSWMCIEIYAYLVDLYSALGDVDKALGYYNKLKRFSLSPGFTFPGISFGAFLAYRNLTLGQSQPEHQDLVAEALSWAENSNLKPTDDFHYEREYEYRILAHALIAQQRAQEATPLLDRLIISAEEGGRNGDLILYLSLQATAHHSMGKSDLALTHLSRALTLAEPEGYVRTFVDLGQPMNDLLKIMVDKGICPLYTSRLLAAFPIQESSPARLLRPMFDQLVEPLNDREMQILRLMSARLSNREIAGELYLSVNTVKWYARSIYDKLGVANRREAGSRARELGIL
jgi:LuxR family maltose regulon positive regulatory protein